MPTKKGTTLAEFAIYELAFIERKLEEMQGYLDKNPLHKIEDRYDISGKNVIQTIEKQVDSMTQTLQRYAMISEIAARMRKGEEEKQLSVRGSAKLSAMDKGLLEDDD